MDTVQREIQSGVALTLATALHKEASDGTVKRFAPHDVLLAEDTSGKGHKSRVVSATESLAIVVQLPS